MADGDAVLARKFEYLPVEHQVRQPGAHHGPDGLHRCVGAGVAAVDAGAGAASEQPVSRGDNGVQMGAGNRAEHRDEHSQPEDGCGGVRQKLHADIVRRQLRCGDSRTDNDGDKQCCSDELRQESARQVRLMHYRLPAMLCVASNSDSSCNASGTTR